MAQSKQPMALDPVMLQADAEQQTENQAKRFDLNDITKKGEELEELRALLVKASAVAADLSDKINTLETVTLPEMLKSVGLKDLTLTSGAKITLFDVISASITDENREEAHKWLRDNEHGDLIKNNLTLTFGKGEDEIAKELVTKLLQMRTEGETKFGDLVQKEQVHPQTLKAFTKDQLKSGKPFPGELFKLYTGQAVKITT